MEGFLVVAAQTEFPITVAEVQQATPEHPAAIVTVFHDDAELVRYNVQFVKTNDAMV